MLEERVRELKQIIAGHDGENAVDRRFATRVDDLLSAVYDDIGEIKNLPPRALFDLFIIKVLYVGRGSRYADVIEYLGALLEEYLYTRALFPRDEHGAPQKLYFSDMLDRHKTLSRFQNLFEAYRKYGDNALFITGVFPASLGRRRHGGRGVMRRRAMRGVDRGYYVTTGKTMYGLASQHELADDTQQRETLEKLARNFEVYVDALNELAERYILGFDMNLIADKMLDNFNRYRTSGDEQYLTNARRYAALLRLDRERFPSLFSEQTGS